MAYKTVNKWMPCEIITCDSCDTPLEHGTNALQLANRSRTFYFCPDKQAECIYRFTKEHAGQDLEALHKEMYK